MGFFTDILLRVATRSGFTTKGSNLTATEVDENFLAIVDEMANRDIAGNLVTWSAGTVDAGEVRIYDSKLWLALTSNSATPSEGSDWTQINLGVLGHAQNTDTYLDRFGANEVTAAQVKTGIRPYEVYTILISQTSTSAPTAIVLENTTGETPTFSRIDVGVYGINATGLFTSDKTFCIINSGDDNFSIFRNSADQVRITTADAAGAATDGLLTKVEVEIRVYP